MFAAFRWSNYYGKEEMRRATQLDKICWLIQQIDELNLILQKTLREVERWEEVSSHEHLVKTIFGEEK